MKNTAASRTEFTEKQSRNSSKETSTITHPPFQIVMSPFSSITRYFYIMFILVFLLVSGWRDYRRAACGYGQRSSHGCSFVTPGTKRPVETKDGQRRNQPITYPCRVRYILIIFFSWYCCGGIFLILLICIMTKPSIANLKLQNNMYRFNDNHSGVPANFLTNGVFCSWLWYSEIITIYKNWLTRFLRQIISAGQRPVQLEQHCQYVRVKLKILLDAISSIAVEWFSVQCSCSTVFVATVNVITDG